MKERIDLYTVDRERMGVTAARDAKIPDGTYRLVVHVCIFNSAGEMLIQKRAEGIERCPGMWDISTGGGACAGETSRDTAQRETEEELGLKIDFSNRRPVMSVNFHDGFDDFFTVEMDLSADELALQKEEVADARWASREEIEAMIDDGSFIPFEKDMIGFLFHAREGRGTWNL